MAEDYYDLGTYERRIVTPSPWAREWFRRGLIWCYAFNHEEAISCFERALAADPDLALAHWGIAYAVGPNYNKGWDAFDPADLAHSLARARSELAAATTGRKSTVEVALISALTARFATDIDDLESGHIAYADAMVAVAAQFPTDLDVVALTADALLNVTAWALWDVRTGEPAPGSRVSDALALLDAGLAAPDGTEHPGLLHLYIHALEMAANPEAAEAAANQLRGLVPDAGHLEHMPSHIDVLCGDYRAGIAANESAVRADRKFVERGGPWNFYSLYRAHDLHFIVYCAMFAGRYADAITAATELQQQLTPELLTAPSPPMADWLETFAGLRIHVLVRFGRWDEVLAEPLPRDRDLYCATTATVHYGRAIAYATTGELGAAERERDLFLAAYQRVPQSRYLFNNTARDILAVAAVLLDGEVTYRAGRPNEAFVLLEQAAQLSDNLPFDEPWGWMQPVRHAWGALLLEQGHVDRAAQVYEADLGISSALPRACQHPNNVWALHGYHECLTRQGRSSEAATVARQLQTVLADADVPVRASCACRRGVVEDGGEFSDEQSR